MGEESTTPIRRLLIKANRDIKSKRPAMFYGDAHDLCYSAADARFPGKRPLKTLAKCPPKCWWVTYEESKKRVAVFFAAVRKGSQEIERGQTQRSRHQPWAGTGAMK